MGSANLTNQSSGKFPSRDLPVPCKSRWAIFLTYAPKSLYTVSLSRINGPNGSRHSDYTAFLFADSLEALDVVMSG